MIYRSKDSNKTIKALFIKEDEILMSAKCLLEILYHLEEQNFDESVIKIKESNFSSEDIARNIIRCSMCNRSKIQLLVRLIIELNGDGNIMNQMMNLFNFGKKIDKAFFYFTLVDNKLIDSSIKRFLLENKDGSFYDSYDPLCKVVIEDDIDELEKIASSPNFDVNFNYHFFYSPSMLLGLTSLSLVGFAALCGAIECFRFLFINDAILEIISDFDYNMMILRLLEETSRSSRS